MPEEYKLHIDTGRGLRAKELLDNELLTECFAILKETYFNQLMATTVMQTAIREKCYMALRVVDVVQGHLQTVIDRGKMAENDLAELAKVAERRKKMGVV